jgi:AcrR family transcriptional regulator
MNPRKDQIIGQVTVLYYRYGIKSVTMDDVARQLGISKKTLYEFFRDKKDLVEHVLLNDYQLFCSFKESIREQDFNAVEEMFELYKMLIRLFQDYNPSMMYDVRKYYPDLFNRLKVLRRSSMLESVQTNLEKGKSEGLYRADLNSDIIARLHVSRVESMLDNDMFTQEEIASFAVFHEIFVYHIHGILSDEGRQFFNENFGKFRSSLEF